MLKNTTLHWKSHCCLVDTYYKAHGISKGMLWLKFLCQREHCIKLPWINNYLMVTNRDKFCKQKWHKRLVTYHFHSSLNSGDASSRLQHRQIDATIANNSPDINYGSHAHQNQYFLVHVLSIKKSIIYSNDLIYQSTNSSTNHSTNLPINQILQWSNLSIH